MGVPASPYLLTAASLDSSALMYSFRDWTNSRSVKMRSVIWPVGRRGREEGKGRANERMQIGMCSNALALGPAAALLCSVCTLLVHKRR